MNMDTDKLIETLSSDLKPVRIVSHPLIRALPWILFACAYVWMVSVWLGVRGDIFIKLNQPGYVFEILLILSMSVSAALCSLWLCLPDMRGQKWLLGVPLTLFAMLLVWITVHTGLKTVNAPHFFWHSCIEDAFVLGVLPAAALLFLAAQGKTTRPKIMSFMNALAVGGLGYLALRVTCASEDVVHILAFHLMPYFFLWIIISVIGKKIYRW